MRLQERLPGHAPAPLGSRVDPVVVQDPLHRGPSDLVAEVRERPADPCVPPLGMLDRHPDHARGHVTSRHRPASTAAGAAVVCLGDHSPVPAENRVRRDDAGDLHHDAPSELLAAHGESTALGIGPAKRPRAQVLPEVIDYTPGSESNLNLLNSLANAYFDLAKTESERGAPSERILELRRSANDATRKAYGENPTSPFVIETYVKNLLQSMEVPPAQVVEQCIEALGILASALTTNEAVRRASQLGALADEALAILFQQTPSVGDEIEPARAVDVLVKAWTVLAEGGGLSSGMALSDMPEANRVRALDVLAHPAGRGNMQVIRLTLDLICVGRPHAFKQQLELIKQLQATDYRMTPQTRLEYAILLFQSGRTVEGDKMFRSLRHLWRDGEHFVQVPERLRWLRADDGRALKTVQAFTGSDYDGRAMARVREFNQVPVPFRPEEFGVRDLKPGMRFACHVSFGHNGPFLRSATAGPMKVD